MPKVNQEYFENKRKIILEAAMRVFQRKPAYSVTMKDIVKESGLSQGGVYKYYSNIDKNVLGVWQDDLRPEIIYRIRQKDDGNYVIDIGEADDMSKWLEMFKLREEYKNTFRVFFDIEGEDYFIIDHRNGDLVVGDNYGYIATWKPFR